MEVGGRKMNNTKNIVIIGGGPAGMAATIEAVRAGAHCTLIDEAPLVGGQVYRQVSGHFQAIEKPLNAEQLRGKRLLAEFKEIAEHIEVLNSTSVLGIWKNHEVLWGSEGASGVINADQLIIASGAYERPVPFPGWTLPGVMTAGGVKSFIKTMHVKPGLRAVVSGAGPLIISTANRLHEIGVEVIAVLESGNPPWSSPSFLNEWTDVEYAKDIADDLAELKRNDIPLLFNHSVFEAHGMDEVSSVTYGPVDFQQWKPLKDQEITIDADLVVLGFGFIPNTELSQLAGCQHEFYNGIGWFVSKDELMQTSVPWILSAGDSSKIGGAVLAEDEGRIAGIRATENLGLISAYDAKNRYEKPLRRIRAFETFRNTINEASAFRKGLLALITPDTLVCRCEEVALSQVKEAIDHGIGDLQSLKLFTRLGMGSCQGRNCAPSMGEYLCHALNRIPEEVGRINPRPPVKPVTLGALAQMAMAEKAIESDSFDAINRGGIQ